jgi:N-methylhydantoinase A/oxoprolinase/acetone carboxylase beta subunit
LKQPLPFTGLVILLWQTPCPIRFTKRGYDPRVFALVAGGAAGPTCALKIAQELHISKIIIPKYAPIYSAFGMLDVDLIHDFQRFYHADENSLNLNMVKNLYKEMEAEALQVLGREGIPKKDRLLERTMKRPIVFVEINTDEYPLAFDVEVFDGQFVQDIVPRDA